MPEWMPEWPVVAAVSFGVLWFGAAIGTSVLHARQKRCKLTNPRGREQFQALARRVQADLEQRMMG